MRQTFVARLSLSASSFHNIYIFVIPFTRHIRSLISRSFLIVSRTTSDELMSWCWYLGKIAMTGDFLVTGVGIHSGAEHLNMLFVDLWMYFFLRINDRLAGSAFFFISHIFVSLVSAWTFPVFAAPLLYSGNPAAKTLIEMRTLISSNLSIV